MRHRRILVMGSAVALAIVLAVLLFALNKPSKAPNTNGSDPNSVTLGSEQINESVRQQQEELVMQPDINNEEFLLTAAAVSCASTEVNGAANQDCSGNIHIVPKANEMSGTGLYKIDEHTKLRHNGQEQDLNILTQLSQNQTIVRLTLVASSDVMLAEIRY